MRRFLVLSALALLTSCGENPPGCPDLTSPSTPEATPDPSATVRPTTSVGPGTITFVNSDPAPGSSISGCGPNVGGCRDRLKIVFNLQPDVDLQSQRLHVSLLTQAAARIDCFSTVFDLPKGQAFPIQVSCPDSGGGAATPFATATMTVATGSGAASIEQGWKAVYTFLP